MNDAAKKYYGKRFIETFLENLKDGVKGMPLEVAIDPLVDRIVQEYAKLAAEAYDESFEVQQLPIESWSLDQDIANLETRLRAGVATDEGVTRLISVLRRMVRERNSFTIPSVPWPGTLTNPIPGSTPWIPPVQPIYPTVPVGPTIICNTSEVKSVADATGHSDEPF